MLETRSFKRRLPVLLRPSAIIRTEKLRSIASRHYLNVDPAARKYLFAVSGEGEAILGLNRIVSCYIVAKSDYFVVEPFAVAAAPEKLAGNS